MVAEQCKAHRVSTLVVDPVLVSTSGHSLGDSEVASALKERSAGSLDRLCLPACLAQCMCLCLSSPCVLVKLDTGIGIQVSWVVMVAMLPARKLKQQCLFTCRLFPLATVITPNLAEAAALLDGRKISSIDDMKAAARDLHALGPQYVLVKGGHLEQGKAVLSM